MIDTSMHIVFDLDDTLYPEIDYSRSALKFVGDLVEAAFTEKNVTTFLFQKFEDGERDAIGVLWAERGLPNSLKSQVLTAMHGHRPEIELPPSSVKILKVLAERRIQWSILTDGRSLTQRRKIEALGLTGASGIYISEERGVSKPGLRAFTQIMDNQPEAKTFCHVADNPEKDFVTPNALGWNTVMLVDCDHNIHPQNGNVPSAFRAKLEVRELTELLEAEWPGVRKAKEI